ncbi:MAG: hypothetical protein CMI53_00390 [Parcubacteria group bacterium]|nr:hypothetical protein [Parcubacteria group bacterium]|tara:strand:+ start:5697 stop:6248 length:552 start_codon:yes stop_codon:yes gene_type:complete
MEIEKSIERQKFYPKFLQSYSRNYEKQGFTRVQQFFYHIENYLAEIYIFHERTISLLNKIKREAKKVGIPVKELKQVDILKKYFRKSLNGIVGIRGRHTHVQRFVDYDTISLESIDNYLTSSIKMSKKEKNKYEAYRKLLLMMARHQWKKKIRKNNKTLLTLLDAMFYVLNKRKIITNIAKRQ